MVNWWNLPWCIGGDFNEILFLSERYSEASFSLSMSEFSYFIFEPNLVHLPLVGGRFTLSNNQDTPSWSSLLTDFLYLQIGKCSFPKIGNWNLLLKKHTGFK